MTTTLEGRSADERKAEMIRDEKNVIRRINRRLPQFHQLHKSRGRTKQCLGNYYVIDHYRNAIIDHHIRYLHKYLSELE